MWPCSCHLTGASVISPPPPPPVFQSITSKVSVVTVGLTQFGEVLDDLSRQLQPVLKQLQETVDLPTAVQIVNSGTLLHTISHTHCFLVIFNNLARIMHVSVVGRAAGMKWAGSSSLVGGCSTNEVGRVVDLRSGRAGLKLKMGWKVVSSWVLHFSDSSDGTES